MSNKSKTSYQHQYILNKSLKCCWWPCVYSPMLQSANSQYLQPLKRISLNVFKDGPRLHRLFCLSKLLKNLVVWNAPWVNSNKLIPRSCCSKQRANIYNKSRDNLHTSLDVVSLLASTSCDLTYKGIQICYKLSTCQPYTPEIFWQSWSYQSNSNFQCLLKVLLDKYRLTTTRQLFVGIEIDGDVCVSRWRQRMIDTFNTNPTIVGQKTSSEM